MAQVNYPKVGEDKGLTKQNLGKEALQERVTEKVNPAKEALHLLFFFLPCHS
jgi:hypothetical protein